MNILKKTSILFFIIICFSCTNKDVWEYKTLKIAGQESAEMSKFNPLTFENQNQMLNSLGQEGWELVNVYAEVETKFPNFGNSEYVTGLRENIRTSCLNFIFKRKLTKKENNQ